MLKTDYKDPANVKVQCRGCGNNYTIRVDLEDIRTWQNGELIQNALGYLTIEERELIKSRICGPCFDQIFQGED